MKTKLLLVLLALVAAAGVFGASHNVESFTGSDQRRSGGLPSNDAGFEGRRDQGDRDDRDEERRGGSPKGHEEPKWGNIVGGGFHHDGDKGEPCLPPTPPKHDGCEKPTEPECPPSQVPDAGFTLLMAGGAVAALATLRRKRG